MREKMTDFIRNISRN